MCRIEEGSWLRRGVVRMMLATVLWSATTAPAGAPIPVAPDAYTMRDYEADRLAFERRHGLEMYKTAGCRSAPWDDAALALIDDFLQCCYARNPREAERASIVTRGRDLIEQGCDDPLVHFAVGRALNWGKRRVAAERYLSTAMGLLSERGYPAHWRARAAGDLARFLRSCDRDEEAERCSVEAVSSMIDAIQGGIYGDADRRLLYADLEQLVVTDLAVPHAEALCARLAEMPGLHPWLVEAVSGRMHIQAAWEARGIGLAYRVTDEGWEGWREHMSRASEHLQRAFALDRSCPEAPARMIEVATTGFAPDSLGERYWFDQAVAAQFDWADAYSLLRNGLHPKWGGSLSALYAFGLECKATERYDTDVPYGFIQCLLNMGNIDEAALRYWSRPGVYDEAHEVLERVMAEERAAADRRWYLSLEAGMAWRANRMAECRALLERLGYDPDPDAIRHAKVTSRELLDEAIVRSTDAWPLVQEGDAAMLVAWYDDAVKAYEAAGRAGGAEDVRLQEVLRDRLATAQLMRHFATGAWTPFVFERGFPGWRIRQGAWQVAGPRAVKAGPKPDGLYLLCQAPFGSRWELRGRIDASSLGRYEKSNLGILFHYGDYVPESDSHSAFLYPRRGELVIRRRYENETAVRAAVAKKARGQIAYDVHLQVWGREAVIIVNGEQVFCGTLPGDPRDTPGVRLGFAGQYARYNGFGRFEDFEIRRLGARPAALSAPHDETAVEDPENHAKSEGAS